MSLATHDKFWDLKSMRELYLIKIYSFLSCIKFQVNYAHDHNTFFHFVNEYNSISEKAMATHSSALAWEIPCTEEPGRL